MGFSKNYFVHKVKYVRTPTVNVKINAKKNQIAQLLQMEKNLKNRINKQINKNK